MSRTSAFSASLTLSHMRSSTSRRKLSHTSPSATYEPFFDNRQRDMRRILVRPPHSLLGGLVVRVLGLEDIRHIGLRISVDYRKPSALNLDHNLVSLKKTMVIIVDIDRVFVDFVR